MEPWYKDGLKFGCTQCGKCCTGFPGYVWVSDAEIEKMSAFLGITSQEFTRRYTREIHGRRSLRETPVNYDCVFFKDKKCQLYGARPKQCRTFPFWSENLSSKEEWQTTAELCEGIDHPDAPLVPLAEIEKARDA